MLLQEKTCSSITSVPVISQSHQNLTEQMVLSKLQNAVACIHIWIARSRQRRALRHLDDRLLDDIGLTRKQASRETSKPFWQE